MVQEISCCPYNGDQYYASVPDVVSLWTDHFQIPTSTLTSTDLNGGNVVHDSYHGGTNNTCLSLYTVIEEYGFPGDRVWSGPGHGWGPK